MTDEEKAEEYVKNVRTEWENQTYWVDCTDEVKQAYLDGLAEGRKEKCIIEQDKDGTIKLCDIAKENAELKAQIERLEEDKEQIIFESDLKIKALEEMIEKMKNVGNCKHTMQCSKWVEKKLYLGQLGVGRMKDNTFYLISLLVSVCFIVAYSLINA